VRDRDENEMLQRRHQRTYETSDRHNTMHETTQ
jgi:hypothetical protein